MYLSALVRSTLPSTTIRHSSVLLRLSKRCNWTAKGRSVHLLAAQKRASYQDYRVHGCVSNNSTSSGCQISLGIQCKRHHSTEDGQVRVRFAPSPTGKLSFKHIQSKCEVSQCQQYTPSMHKTMLCDESVHVCSHSNATANALSKKA